MMSTLHPDDPRQIYPGLTAKKAYAGWPCSQCDIRRDEHADQDVQSDFPQLDITDHVFVGPMECACDKCSGAAEYKGYCAMCIGEGCDRDV